MRSRNINGLKYCKSCETTKPVLEYYSKCGGRTHYSRCKDCLNTLRRTNGTHRATAKRSRSKARQEALSHYSNGSMSCACCAESMDAFLTLDHIFNDGNIQRRQDPLHGQLAIWLRKNNYPEGYQVLCMNCNFAKGKLGECPHFKDIHCRTPPSLS